jgi:hypothetical protein
MKVMQMVDKRFLILMYQDLGKERIGKSFDAGVPIINHDLSGGSDKVTYSVSGSHLDQEGIMVVTSLGF